MNVMISTAKFSVKNKMSGRITVTMPKILSRIFAVINFFCFCASTALPPPYFVVIVILYLSDAKASSVIVCTVSKNFSSVILPLRTSPFR